MRRRIFLAGLAAGLAAPAARAQDKPAEAEWGAPTADYTATLTFTDNRGQRVAMRLAYTDLKQRLEYLDRSGREQEVVIVDGEAKLLYVMRPGRKQFGKADYARPDYDFRVSAAETKRRFEAAETLDGRAVRQPEHRCELRGQPMPPCGEGAGMQAGDAADAQAFLSLCASLQVDPQRLGDEATKNALRRNTEEAIAHGVFGVPTLEIDGELFWGADSIEFLTA